MSQEIELSRLDLRYESHRMRQPSVEARLLSDIAERGIAEPLEGVGNYILLNGFKRYRSARKLNISTVPYVSLGKCASRSYRRDESEGAREAILRRVPCLFVYVYAAAVYAHKRRNSGAG
jgi:hypothetical protein